MYLYKYRGLSGSGLKHVVETIEKSRIKFNSVREFNDPFEMLPIFELKGNDKALREMVGRMVANVSPRGGTPSKKEMTAMLQNREARAKLLSVISAATREQLEELGVYCLSEVNDDILMWGYYTDSHKGICLRFKSEDQEPFFGRAQPVKYSAARPVVDRSLQSEAEMAESAFLTKAECWKHEKEWRVIELDGHGIKSFDPSLLDGIVLGAKISPADEGEIRKAVANRGGKIQLYRSQLSKSSFSLEVVPTT